MTDWQSLDLVSTLNVSVPQATKLRWEPCCWDRANEEVYQTRNLLGVCLFLQPMWMIAACWVTETLRWLFLWRTMTRWEPLSLPPLPPILIVLPSPHSSFINPPYNSSFLPSSFSFFLLRPQASFLLPPPLPSSFTLTPSLFTLFLPLPFSFFLLSLFISHFHLSLVSLHLPVFSLFLLPCFPFHTCSSSFYILMCQCVMPSNYICRLMVGWMESLTKWASSLTPSGATSSSE